MYILLRPNSDKDPSLQAAPHALYSTYYVVYSTCNCSARHPATSQLAKFSMHALHTFTFKFIVYKSRGELFYETEFEIWTGRLQG